MANKLVGVMLRKLRRKKGLTQSELCRKAKLSQPYLALLETGEKTNPSLAILQRLAKALGVPITELLQ